MGRKPLCLALITAQARQRHTFDSRLSNCVKKAMELHVLTGACVEFEAEYQGKKYVYVNGEPASPDAERRERELKAKKKKAGGGVGGGVGGGGGGGSSGSSGSGSDTSSQEAEEDRQQQWLPDFSPEQVEWMEQAGLLQGQEEEDLLSDNDLDNFMKILGPDDASDDFDLASLA